MWKISCCWPSKYLILVLVINPAKSLISSVSPASLVCCSHPTDRHMSYHPGESTLHIAMMEKNYGFLRSDDSVYVSVVSGQTSPVHWTWRLRCNFACSTCYYPDGGVSRLRCWGVAASMSEYSKLWLYKLNCRFNPLGILRSSDREWRAFQVVFARWQGTFHINFHEKSEEREI